MKKLLSIVLSLVMLAAVGIATVPVFAAGTVVSPESTTTTTTTTTTAPAVTHNKIIPQVNGNDSSDVTWDWISDSPKTIKFTYNGDGTVTGWTFSDLKEGVDYEVVAQDDNSITIRLLKDYNGDITANAIVEEEDGKTTKSSSKTTVKTNKSSTSPKTGAAAAAGIAAMGAGLAVLAAAKKKRD